MRCYSTAIWLALLGFMSTIAWGAEDVVDNTQTNGQGRAIKSDEKNVARKNYRASHYWGPRGASKPSTRNGGYYGEDEDEDEDDGYYGSDSYGSDSYGSDSYAPSYGSYAPQVIQIPQVQSSYYSQQQPSVIPILVPSGGGGGTVHHHYKKKKKKNYKPVCCCNTALCLETCDPAISSLCMCDQRCCLRYPTLNPGCANAMFPRRQLDPYLNEYFKQFDDLPLEDEDRTDEETQE